MDDTVKPSMAKSLVAQAKPRIGGRFVSLKEEDASPKTSKRRKEKEITKDELTYDTRLLSEEEKEYIGEGEGMAYRFYEIALKKSRTAAEAHRYASILIQYQTAKISSKDSSEESEITHKVLQWGWDGINEDNKFDQLMQKKVEEGEDDTKHSDHEVSVHPDADSVMDTQESEEV